MGYVGSPEISHGRAFTERQHAHISYINVLEAENESKTKIQELQEKT